MLGRIQKNVGATAHAPVPVLSLIRRRCFQNPILRYKRARIMIRGHETMPSCVVVVFRGPWPSLRPATVTVANQHAVRLPTGCAVLERAIAAFQTVRGTPENRRNDHERQRGKSCGCQCVLDKVLLMRWSSPFICRVTRTSCTQDLVLRLQPFYPTRV